MTEPDNTAVRVALWRALHLEIDPPPHVLTDELAIRLVDPAPGWQQRRDMDPRWTTRNRASIVGRARFVEDLVDERVAAGVAQYVILGAGLDTFALRRTAAAQPDLQIFEIDQPATQAWKHRRLTELALEVPSSLHFVPVDFETGASWSDALGPAGFDASAPAVVASTGVSMYLTEPAIVATLRDVAALATGSVLVMSFMLPLASVDADEQQALQGAARGAAAGGTPWISFFEPESIVALAREAGFADVRHVSPDDIAGCFFAGRPDGLRPSSAEHLIVATI